MFSTFRKPVDHPTAPRFVEGKKLTMKWFDQFIPRKTTKAGLRRSRRRRFLELEPLEDRALPSTLAITNGVLTYGETSGVNHNLSVAYLASSPGRYVITDSENFTQIPPGWSGV